VDHSSLVKEFVLLAKMIFSLDLYFLSVWSYIFATVNSLQAWNLTTPASALAL
jgi:hypothetical protein